MNITVSNLDSFEEYNELKRLENNTKLGDISPKDLTVWTNENDDSYAVNRFLEYLEENYYDSASYNYVQTLSGWIESFVDYICDEEPDEMIDSEEMLVLLNWALKQKIKVLFYEE